MKQFYLKALTLCLLSIQSATTTYAQQDIAELEFTYNGLYYYIDHSPITDDVDAAVVVVPKPHDEDSDEEYGYSGDIIVPASVTYEGNTYIVERIGEGAFAECDGLKSVVIPNTVLTIDDEAFGESVNLKRVEIPNSVRTIGENAFGDCEKLVSIHLPEKLTLIASKTFKSCTSLTEIEIPSAVESIGQRAFSDCENLTTVKVNMQEPFAIDESVFGIRDDNRNWQMNPAATLYVPIGTAELYRATDGWKLFKNIVEIDMSSIERFTAEASPEAYYSIYGHRSSSMQRGLNIVRMSDGTTRKVMVK